MGQRISKRVIDGTEPSNLTQFIWDVDCKGFGLKVTPTGAKSYVLQYRMGGREASTRRYTIGRHGSPWTPDSARREAERLLLSVKQGIDPVDMSRQRRREAVTLAFDEYAPKFVEFYLKPNWTDSWAEGKRILERDIVPVFGRRSLSGITRSDVTDLLDRYVDRPAMRKNIHSVLRKIFNWAVDRGDIRVSPISGMKAPKPVPSRQRVLSHEEFVCIWLAAERLGYPWCPVFRLLMVTLQRRMEVAGLVWVELDIPNAVWRLPPERAKNDESHDVPLSRLALAEIVAIEPRPFPLVFTRTGRTPVSGFSDAKERIDLHALAIMQERAAARGEDVASVRFKPWRIHDFRRTGTTNLQALGFPVEVTEAVINHRSGSVSGVAGVYNRHKYDNEKRHALDAWSCKVAEIVHDARGGI